MSKELGTLVVVVLKARNLLDKHSFYKQDVFAQVTVQGTTKKTKIDVKGGQHPVWDEELRFPVLDQGKKGMMMEVSCWSKEPRSDDLVGKGELDITETLRTGEFDDWIPLNVNNGQRGDLYLEMTFFAAGPPPALSRRPSKMLPADRLARAPQTSPPSTTPSSPPLAAGHRPALTAESTHLRPQSAAAQRLSPRPKTAELPPLPEEPTSDGPSPAAVPAILRPGGGAAHNRSRSSLSGSPGASFSTPGAQPPVSPPHQSSLPAPNSLRPGGGLSPVPHTSPPSRTSSYIPETQIPSLPATALGHVPASIPTPQPPRIASPEQSAYDYRPLHVSSAPSTPYQPAHTPTPYQAAHTPTPQSSVHTPTPQPSIHTPAPYQPAHTSPNVYPAYDPRPAPSPQPHHQRTYSNPQEYLGYDPRPHPTASPAPSAYPPAPYPPQPQSPPYDHRVPALPPQTSAAPSFSPPQAQWQAPPPTSYPHLQPSTSFTPGVGGFAFPTASVPPPAPGAYYPPYAPAPPQRPYPYNYPPPPRDSDLDYEPRSNPRYQKPLPLPDEPAGAGTPTPAHPHGANGHRHRKSAAGSEAKSAAGHETRHEKAHEKAHESAEARDRRLAAEFAHEEEERRRVAREQEERDLELARRLDLELNLAEEEAAATATPTAEVPNGHAHANGGGSDMPGSWYRHRPEA